MKKKQNNSLIVLNTDLITKVVSELGNENFTFIINLIEELHPADTADLLETLNSEDRKKVVKIIKDNFPSETLPSMNVPILLDIIEEFEISQLVRMLSELDTDDITYVLEICDEDLRKKILLGMPNELKKLMMKNNNSFKVMNYKFDKTDTLNDEIKNFIRACLGREKSMTSGLCGQKALSVAKKITRAL